MFVKLLSLPRKIKGSLSSTSLNRYKLNLAKVLRYLSCLGYPSELMVEPTNYCNAKCPLCPTGAGQLKRPKGFMSFSLFKKIIDEVAGKTSHITLFNYGEPFLHPKIFQMIEHAKEKKIKLYASTNGYVFYKDRQIEKLARSNLDFLVVSLDGATKKVFSMYRKNVNFDKVIKGLKKLKRLKKKANKIIPKVEIQFIIMRQNEHELSKMKKLASKLGDSLLLKTVNTQMVKGARQSDWIPKDQFFSRYIKNNEGNYVPKKQNFHNCPLIWKSLVINWDGTVNPCCYDYQSEVILGNVKTDTISDIWTGKAMRNFRALVLSDRRQNQICRGCPVDLSSEKLIKLTDSSGTTRVKIKKFI